MVTMLKFIFMSILHFLSILFIYVVYIRIIKPKTYIKHLFIIFLGLPIVAYNFTIFTNVYPAKIILPIEFLYISIAISFIQTYPAIHSWAPSLKIVYIMKNNNKMLNEDMLKKHFNNKNLIMDRFNDLFNDGFIKITKNNIELTMKGKLLASFFYYYRKLLGLKEGDG